jgi:hypothetical protein
MRIGRNLDSPVDEVSIQARAVFPHQLQLLRFEIFFERVQKNIEVGIFGCDSDHIAILSVKSIEIRDFLPCFIFLVAALLIACLEDL